MKYILFTTVVSDKIAPMFKRLKIDAKRVYQSKKDKMELWEVPDYAISAMSAFKEKHLKQGIMWGCSEGLGESGDIKVLETTIKGLPAKVMYSVMHRTTWLALEENKGKDYISEVYTFTNFIDYCHKAFKWTGLAQIHAIAVELAKINSTEEKELTVADIFNTYMGE